MCDAIQRVIADFYNTNLARRGKGDVFSKADLLGYKGQITWKQEDDALVIQCPDKMPCATAIGFRIIGK